MNKENMKFESSPTPPTEEVSGQVEPDIDRQDAPKRPQPLLRGEVGPGMYLQLRALQRDEGDVRAARLWNWDGIVLARSAPYKCEADDLPSGARAGDLMMYVQLDDDDEEGTVWNLTEMGVVLPDESEGFEGSERTYGKVLVEFSDEWKEEVKKRLGQRMFKVSSEPN